MKFAIGLIGSTLMVFAPGLHAQSELVGKYSGSLSAVDFRGRDKSYGISVEITSAENGRLAGTLTNEGSRGCPGKSAMAGTYEGNKVTFATVKGDDKNQGCGVQRFEGVADGGKLVGKMPHNGAPHDVQLSK